MARTNRRYAPDPVALAQIRCPVERAARISRLARRLSNLPPALAALRLVALREAREAGCTTITLGAALRMTPARISQLLTAAAPPLKDQP